MVGIKGYLSMEWMHLASQGFSDAEVAKQEGRGILHQIRGTIKALQNLTQEIWKARNTVLHGTNEVDMKHTRQAELPVAEILDSQAPGIGTGRRPPRL